MDETGTSGGSPLLDLLFDDPSVGRCLVAPDGSVLRANSEWLRSTGLALDHVLGADIVDLFPETRDAALAMHARARAGERVEVPRRAQPGRGGDTWWEGRIEPVRMDNGVGLLLTAREATVGSRRDTLLGVTEIYERFLGNSDDGVLLARPDGSILRANPAACAILGMTEEQIKAAGRQRLVIPSARVAEMVAERERTGLVHGEVTFRRGDGTTFPAMLTSTALPLASGEGCSFVIFRDVTARQQADLALRDSEERFRIMADGAPVILWVTDARGHNQFVNRAYRDFFGVTMDEVEGTKWRPLVHPEDAPGYEEGVLRAVRERAPFSGEARVRRMDGEWRWIASRGQPRVSETGEFLGHVGISLDITPRKRAEEALRESEERLRLFVEYAPAAVAMFDRQMRYLAVSRRFASDYRTPIQDLLGRSHYEVFPEIPERWREIHRRCLDGNVEACAEDPFPRADGTLEWIKWEMRPWRTAAGAVGGVVLFSEVITQRRQVEAALRESEARFRTMADGTPIIIWVADAADKIEFVNRAYREFFGTSMGAGEIGGWRQLLHPDDAPGYIGAFTAALAARRPFQAQARVRRADGEWRWIESYASPRFSPTGEFLGMAGSSPDITERKRAEEDLREANRQKAEFLAVLSHELRNPLAPIRNSIYLLERAAPGSAQALRAKDVLRRQTEHLARLVDDLLDLTRISRGKIDIQRARVDLCQVVRKTTDDLSSLFEQGGIEFHVEHPAEPVWIDADATRIAQAIGNLLQNAAKFTPKGGKVGVRLTASGADTELSVFDNGLGMQPDLVERMFEPFAQGDHALARTKGGLGLGLSLVKRLVELHGGSVHARSEGPGRGAEFTITLPRSMAGGPSARRLEGTANGQNRLILVIEDNADAGETLAEILELEGHRVRIAPDGRSGLELAREIRPDVVFCDIGLPDLDGYEVARTLRSEDSLRETCLIAVTGYAQPEDVARARSAGFDAHVAKPASLEKLVELLAMRPR